MRSGPYFVKMLDGIGGRFAVTDLNGDGTRGIAAVTLRPRPEARDLPEREDGSHDVLVAATETWRAKIFAIGMRSARRVTGVRLTAHSASLAAHRSSSKREFRIVN